MTKEEKVMFLMRLAVETHNAYRSGQLAAGKSGSFVQDRINAVVTLPEQASNYGLSALVLHWNSSSW
ncbi:TPA: hypothetical protein ACNROG_000955 [Citrobacter koseri]